VPRKSATKPAPQLYVDDLLNMTADALIGEHLRLKDWMAAESKRFGEFLAPHKARLEEIDQKLFAKLRELGTGDRANLATDSGTAYISNLMNVSISPDGAPYTPEQGEARVGREALLDFALDHWDEIGDELLMFQPQKDAVKRWMETHEGQPPPGLKIGWFQKVNVNRS
jgi:hypothetical protein